jgi:hypothetical protein
MTTPSFVNVSTTPNYFLYIYGNGNPNPLASVQVGWYAQGVGVVNAPIISVIDSGISFRIEITPPPSFQSDQSYYFTQTPISNPLCFKVDTKILCLKDSKEVYVPIQELQKGDLVKTLEKGYLKVTIVSTSLFASPRGDERIRHKLYKCTKENYSDITEDLFITGSHSILVNTVTEKEQALIKKHFGKLHVTGRKYRLMAFIDERAIPCTEGDVFTIYHFALENDETCYNYGIYANGLLVECCNTAELMKTRQMNVIDQ